MVTLGFKLFFGLIGAIGVICALALFVFIAIGLFFGVLALIGLPLDRLAKWITKKFNI